MRPPQPLSSLHSEVTLQQLDTKHAWQDVGLPQTSAHPPDPMTLLPPSELLPHAPSVHAESHIDDWQLATAWTAEEQLV